MCKQCIHSCVAAAVSNCQLNFTMCCHACVHSRSVPRKLQLLSVSLIGPTLNPSCFIPQVPPCLQGEFGASSFFGSGASLFTRSIDNPDSEAKSLDRNESPVGRWGSRRTSDNGAAARNKAKSGNSIQPTFKLSRIPCACHLASSVVLASLCMCTLVHHCALLLLCCSHCSC